MSRFGEWDGEEDFNNQGEFWMKRAQLALEGRRGRKALQELRAALLALPEKRLISRALCTVNPDRRIAEHRAEGGYTEQLPDELTRLIEEQGQGVCAIGAYVWHQKVKAGADPVEAFDALPTLDDLDGYDAAGATARIGRDHGLTFTLAWELAEQNDGEYGFGGLSPEQRYAAFLRWIDAQLARPLLTRPPKRERRRRQTPPQAAITHRLPSGAVPMEMGL